MQQNGTGTSTSTNERGFGNVWKDPNTKFAKNDSVYACDLRENTDFTLYRRVGQLFLELEVAKNQVPPTFEQPYFSAVPCKRESVGAFQSEQPITEDNVPPEKEGVSG